MMLPSGLTLPLPVPFAMRRMLKSCSILYMASLGALLLPIL